MPEFTDNALNIIEQRYLAHIGGRKETVEEFIDRISLGNETYRNELIEPLVFLPNSPTLFNVDVPGGGTLSACFKFDVADSMQSDDFSGIMDTATKAALVTKWGGGVGYYLGGVRPKGALVNSTHGKAMGPVALLKFYHAMGSMLTQSGKRDAAQMGILDATHPDIMEFITAKDADPQSLSTFNISVALSNPFMEAAKHVGTYEHEILKHMARSAWRTGDPGVYFNDRAEADNPTPWLGKLTGTNPCGEVPLLNNEPCNLGSINLAKFYDGQGGFDYKGFERAVRLATRYLDDVLDKNHFPVPQVSAAANHTRKLGLGVCGWADLVALCGIRYASEEALDFLDSIIGFMRRASDDESRQLGRDKGIAPALQGRPEGYIFRNATRLCIAPTGTISILMGASSGVEPHYLLRWQRVMGDGQSFTETIPVMDRLPEGFVPQTAMEIPWQWHVRHQAVAQKHVDLAVSKTINMPNSATEEEILEAYQMMWELGCKGGTVYRDGCRETQVLNSIADEEVCPECGAPVKHEETCVECVAGCGWAACNV